MSKFDKAIAHFEMPASEHSSSRRQLTPEQKIQDTTPKNTRNVLLGGIAIAAVCAVMSKVGLIDLSSDIRDKYCVTSPTYTVSGGENGLNQIKYNQVVDTPDGHTLDMREVDATIHRPTLQHPPADAGLPPAVEPQYIKRGDVIFFENAPVC